MSATPGANDDHATAVAGIIAAAANGTGSVGIAYEAQIASLPALSMGSSQLQAALRAGCELDVVNSSWGFRDAYAASSSTAFWTGFNAAIDHGIDTGRGGLGHWPEGHGLRPRHHQGLHDACRCGPFPH